MAFDYKKEYRQWYQPKKTPQIVTIPAMQFAAVWGHGDPNEPDGEYARALQILYSVSYTIKMSDKSGHQVEGFFPYVVPPLEGLWWTASGQSVVGSLDKSTFDWVSMIRLPEFVTPAVFDWAKAQAAQKKGIDTSPAKRFTYDEGLCVQCMHIGSYDDEPQMIARMDDEAKRNGYALDFSDRRYHHEIYLSDPNRVEQEKRKTVIRHPIRRDEA